MIRTSLESDLAIPPGELLKEELKERRMTQVELARRMGRPQQKINEIIKGKRRITEDTAIQLEKVLGISALFWINLEGSYRLALIRGKQQVWHEGPRGRWRLK